MIRYVIIHIILIGLTFFRLIHIMTVLFLKSTYIFNVGIQSKTVNIMKIHLTSSIVSMKQSEAETQLLVAYVRSRKKTLFSLIILFLKRPPFWAIAVAMRIFPIS